MTAGQRVCWTADIQANLGIERLESLDVEITDYTCIVCGDLGVTDLAPASIVLYLADDNEESASIEFAHQGCSTPRIVTVTGSLPSQPPTEGPQLCMSSWIIREPRSHEKLHATILIDSESNVELIDETLGRIDPVLATLLGLGWEQIHALDGRYAELDTCEVVLLPGRAGYLNAPGESGGIVIPRTARHRPGVDRGRTPQPHRRRPGVPDEHARGSPRAPRGCAGRRDPHRPRAGRTLAARDRTRARLVASRQSQ